MSNHYHLLMQTPRRIHDRTESMHGAGSPQAQRIMISRQFNLEQKKKLAKEIVRIQG